MKMQKVTDSFELPKDIVLGLPIVTAYGYNELTIENHKGILSFSDKAVTVRAADSTIKISGSRLEIKEFTKDLIIIAGHLKRRYAGAFGLRVPLEGTPPEDTQRHQDHYTH